MQDKRNTPKRITNRQRTLFMVACMVVLILFCLLIAPTLPESIPAMGYLTGDGASADGNTASTLEGLAFSEVMSANRSAVADDTGEFSDWIELVNEGTTPIALRNIGISDNASAIKFLFPDMTLEPGAYVIVYASGRSSTDPNALHATFKISSSGETLYLFDATGQVLQTLVVPVLERNMAYAKMNGEWVATDRYTPGYPNTDTGYEAYKNANTVENGTLLLNEIMTANRSVIKDEDGDYVDWIELRNYSNSTISLAGYGLSDDETQRMKWQFPKGTVIQPNGYLVIYASGKNRAGTDGQNLHTNFSINATRETIVLSNARGQLLDRIVVEGLDKDQAMARHAVSGEWQIQSQSTPGFSNDRDGAAAYDALLRSRNHMGLFISEVVTYSTGMETPHGTTSYDWIEIVNLNQFPISLKDYGLSDNPGRPRKWQFPDITLQSGQYLLIIASDATPPQGSTALHANFRLSALGQTLVLSDPSGKILDRMVVPQIEADSSYGRNIGQTGFYYYDVPTPGAANVGGFIGYADTPSFSLEGGMFDQAVTLTLNAPDGVLIRYTLDGSDPTELSEAYTQPLAISTTTVVRARGFAAGLRPSSVMTNTYFISVYHSLPVISLVTDPWNLWNEETGMYAGDYTQSSRTDPPYKDQTYWQKNTYGGSFEFFETDGTRVCVAGVELGLHGQFSLDIPQKSFRVTAKARYGSTSLDYAFFDDRPYDSYQSLVIRNGGNDGKYTRIVDGFQSKVVDWVEDTTVYHMPWQPVIVYLNGEYWGHYNIRERVNIHSLARHEGWDDPDNIDLIKGNNNVLNGSFSNYDKLLSFVKNNDLNNPEALQTVVDWVDIDNYFDYMIFEMYFGNTDTGNIKFYRRNAPGEKWKWVLFDLDWGLFDSKTDGCKVLLNPKGTGTGNGFDNTIIRKLLEVPEMRDKFLTRYGQLFQETFQTERMIALMNEMAGEIQEELPMHFSRWAYDNNIALHIEAPANPEGAYSYWQNRVYTRMAYIINRRSNLVWGHVQDWFSLSDAQMVAYFGERPPLPEEAQ